MCGHGKVIVQNSVLDHPLEGDAFCDFANGIGESHLGALFSFRASPSEPGSQLVNGRWADENKVSLWESSIYLLCALDINVEQRYDLVQSKLPNLSFLSTIHVLVHITVFNEIICFNFLLEFLFCYKEIINSMYFSCSWCSSSV